MGYNCIRIEREREGYEVTCTDPKIEEQNRARDGKGDSIGSWKDPQVEFFFETKAQVLTFIEKAMDIALPADEYTSAFDKFAKEAKGTEA